MLRSARSVPLLRLLALTVLGLLRARRLHLSERTVHHHVSAILRKLGVTRRGQAIVEATQRGLVPPG